MSPENECGDWGAEGSRFPRRRRAPCCQRLRPRPPLGEKRMRVMAGILPRGNKHRYKGRLKTEKEGEKGGPVKYQLASFMIAYIHPPWVSDPPASPGGGSQKRGSRNVVHTKKVECRRTEVCRHDGTVLRLRPRLGPSGRCARTSRRRGSFLSTSVCRDRTCLGTPISKQSHKTKTRQRKK